MHTNCGASDDFYVSITASVPRTTIDIDASVLSELKRRQRAERKTLGQLVSELLAVVLAADGIGNQPREISWNTRPMGARVDLEDDEAVRAALDDP